MKIGIFQTGESQLACYDTLRLTEAVRQADSGIDILVGYPDGSAAGRFLKRLEVPNFELRAFSYSVETPGDFFRTRRVRTFSRQVYSLTDGGSDFMDLSGWILSGRLPNDRFASRRPFLVFNTMSIDDVRLYPPWTSVGWFETLQSASGILFADERIGRNLLALAGANGVPSSFDPLPDLPDRLFPSFPFWTDLRPYALYFPRTYSPKFINWGEGEPSHSTYVMPMPALTDFIGRGEGAIDSGASSSLGDHWSLADAFQSAVSTDNDLDSLQSERRLMRRRRVEAIDIDLNSLQSAVAQAKLVICDSIFDPNDVRLVYARRSGTPVLLLKRVEGQVPPREVLKQVAYRDIERYGELEQAAIDIGTYTERKPETEKHNAPSRKTLVVLRNFFNAIRAKTEGSVA